MTRTVATGRGFALVLVLWLLVLLSWITAQILGNSRAELLIARNATAAARAEALADAALAEAVFWLAAPVPAQRWPADGSTRRVVLPGGEATIRVTDEGGRINPNVAPEPLMAALFEALGTETDAARRAAAAIADWIDSNRDRRPFGAEREDYLAAGILGAPADGPVDDVAELADALGVGPDLIARARPHLSVYATAPRPRPESADPVVRRALAIADAGPRRPDDAAQREQPDAAPLVRIRIGARTPDGGSVERDAVVRIGGEGRSGYAVLERRRLTAP